MDAKQEQTRTSLVRVCSCFASMYVIIIFLFYCLCYLSVNKFVYNINIIVHVCAKDDARSWNVEKEFEDREEDGAKRGERNVKEAESGWGKKEMEEEDEGEKGEEGKEENDWEEVGNAGGKGKGEREEKEGERKRSGES